MKKTDEVYVHDILEMILKIESFVGGMTFQDFEKNDQVQFAVFHAFEVIGEAANKLSEAFLKNNPDFPARETVEMRNLLIHGYDRIRLDIVWKTILDNLPVLKKQVQEII